MRLKNVATIPIAFTAGLLAPIGYRMFQVWGYAHRATLAMYIVAYAGLVVTPFLVCVVDVDPRPWNQNDQEFAHTAPADTRRMWLRWAAYFTGYLLGYLILSIGSH
jgi:hypothetical protein